MSKKRLLSIVATVSVAVAGAAAALLPMTASQRGRGLRRRVQQLHRLHRRHARLLQRPQLDRQVVDPVRSAQHRRLRRLGRQRRLRRPAPRRRRRHTCNYPNWVAGQCYPAGSIVRYTNGSYYRAKHENPGYDPVISTWYWEPYTCGGGGTTPPPGGGRAASRSARPSSTRCSRAGTLLLVRRPDRRDQASTRRSPPPAATR